MVQPYPDEPTEPTEPRARRVTGPSRRAVLAAAGAVGVSAVLAGCADETSGRVGGVASEPERITYGDDPSQWVDLHVPEGASRGLVDRPPWRVLEGAVRR